MVFQGDSGRRSVVFKPGDVVRLRMQNTALPFEFEERLDDLRWAERSKLKGMWIKPSDIITLIEFYETTIRVLVTPSDGQAPFITYIDESWIEKII